MAELDEIPFIESLLFVPLIITYTLLKRVQYLAETAIGTSRSVRSEGDDTHLFILNSGNKYRSHAFVEIGSRLHSRGKDVVFVCSPDAANKASDWRKEGFQIEEFPQLLRFVPVSHLPIHVLKAMLLSIGLKKRVPDEYAAAPRPLVFNMIFLEFLKRDSIQPYAPATLHTYSLMPYMSGPAESDRLFVYQHGIQWATEEQAMPSKFIPSTHLLWGEPWRQNFERLTHPETDIQIVGSPWHDQLAQTARKRSVSAEWDVVFLSASNSARSPGRMKSYERLVTDVVEICEEHDLSLAIKLHPSEDGEWYRKRDLDHYVHEFADIESAILSTEIMITNASSVFVECAVMETPIIVADLWGFGLERLGPLSKVYFTSDRDEIESKIEESNHSRAQEEGEMNDIIPIGNSTDRIVELVTRE